MKLGSLFSGVGGMDAGFVAAGFDVRWQCENEPACKDVLRARFPETAVLYDDVTTVDWEQVEPVDVIVGGFPCQDLSVAGRRAGLDGERSGLFFHFARVLDTVRPTLAVIENVPGLLSSNGGKDMAIVLGTLRDIGAVDICWRILDAQYFGVPQRRRRVFLVCDFAGERASAILALPEGLQGHPAPRREARQAVAGSLGGGSGKRGWDSSLDTSGAFIAHSLHLTQDPISHVEASPALSRTSSGMGVTHSLTGVEPDASEDGTGRGTPIIAFDARNDISREDVTSTLQSKKSGGYSLNYQPVVAVRTAQTSSNGWGVNEEETSYTLDGAQGQAVAFAQNQRGELRTSAIAPQLTTGGGKPGEGYPAVLGMGVRRLTPTECEMLMGWEPGHTRYGASGKEMSDAVRYRMCGNGVVTPVAAWIAKRIAEAL